MSAFVSPRIKELKDDKPIKDCSTCQNCVTPVNTIEVPIPFRLAMFCIHDKRYLMKYSHAGNFITGIENAETCPNYHKK